MQSVEAKKARLGVSALGQANWLVQEKDINEELYSIWDNIDTEHRMFFLVNESAQLIWNLCKTGDAERLKDFRERLRADLSFADDELHELELKTSLRDKLKAIYEFGINESTSQELEELLDKVIGYLDKYTETLNTSV